MQKWCQVKSLASVCVRAQLFFLFKSHWVFPFREFCKRMDNSPPFYFFTLNERFRGEDDYPFFDGCRQIDDDVEPAHHPLCLHHLRIIQGEDGSIFFFEITAPFYP